MNGPPCSSPPWRQWAKEALSATNCGGRPDTKPRRRYDCAMTRKNPPAQPKPALAPSKEQEAQRRLAGLGGQAPEIQRVPRRKSSVRIGVAAGRFVVPADFDEPLPPDVQASFEAADITFDPPKAVIVAKPADLSDADIDPPSGEG
jgi:hypothetical protein